MDSQGMDSQGMDSQGMDSQGMDAAGMDAGRMPPSGDDDGAPARRDPTPPPFPDDPRIPKPEDAVPTESRELGGAAPAVGPGSE
ncbi:hypothetical protein [Blastococcus deserti]|uniref:Uncharacterized protein n=1 Tax=Blastococcus deserti TaxID=2259033 RepID=A0ABW4X7V8_9ACTN